MLSARSVQCEPSLRHAYVKTIVSFLLLDEYFLTYAGLEPRLLTRFDCRRYAREAYELGVRYFGGCCGFEPYHMREVAEEVSTFMKAMLQLLYTFGNAKTLACFLSGQHQLCLFRRRDSATKILFSRGL